MDDLISKPSQLLEHDHDDQVAAVFPHDRYLLEMLAPLPTVGLTPTEKKEARRLLTEFFTLAERNRANVIYSQHRPFDPTVDPRVGFTGDCSSYVTQSFNWMRDYLDGPPIHDPNGTVEWDGYGFTGTTLLTNRHYFVPLDRLFYVGDIAIFGSSFWNTKHEIICAKEGHRADAQWSSHGSSSGPVRVKLSYRPNDLLGVYRPLSLH